MFTLKTHHVKNVLESNRLSDYTCGIFNALPSRKSVKKAIKRGEIRLNGEIAQTGTWVKENDIIELIDLELTPPKQYNLDLEVVFEDDYLAVINKPAGIVVSGNQFKTIANSLQGNVSLSTQEDALKWVKPVHRLDNPTSGLLIIAKTAKALVDLGKQFENKAITKKYKAIVVGSTPTKGEIKTPINDLSSLTTFSTIRTINSLRNGTLSLIKLSPKTGRTHQLRIHLSSLGFPIVGDQIYGTKGETLQHKGLFLAAVEIQFQHPILNEMVHVKIDEPNKFKNFLAREERRWNKYN